MSTQRTLLAIAALWFGCTSDVDGSHDLTTAAMSGHDDADEDEVIEYKDVKLLVEHNATDEDTGFQAFLDGEAWKQLEVRGPNRELVLSINVHGRLRHLGLTELFLETQEPPNAEVPIPEIFAKLPEGQYSFRGRTVDGTRQRGTAMLSHLVPVGPVVTMPCDGAIVDADSDLVFAWLPVVRSIDGDPVTVTHYELIVNKLDQPSHPGFGKEKLDLHVPATTTRMRVPHEFLEPGTRYEFEVIAIEAGGAQTITSGELSTR